MSHHDKPYRSEEISPERLECWSALFWPWRGGKCKLMQMQVGKWGRRRNWGSCRRNMARTSAPFVPWDLGRRITALENVWWGDIVIMDLDYDCIFSSSIYTGFGWKRHILTVSNFGSLFQWKSKSLKVFIHTCAISCSKTHMMPADSFEITSKWRFL